MRRGSRLIAVMSFLAIVIVLAGCGSSSTSKSTRPSTTAGGGAPAPSTSVVVFRTPTNDIHCGAYPSSGGSAAYLRCNVIAGMRPLPQKTCRAGDPGLGVDMLAKGRSEAPCFGDPGPDAGFAQHHPFVLGYGKTWKRDGFTCVSRPRGLTCRNLSGHGFTLWVRNWRLF